MRTIGVARALGSSARESGSSARIDVHDLDPRLRTGRGSRQFGENAGVVDVGNGWAVIFKIESHNYPSYVEPYQGAATGVGGIVRDIMSMGARPVAVMDPLRFGALDHPDTARVVPGIVAGVGGYGNCLGLPNIDADPEDPTHLALGRRPRSRLHPRPGPASRFIHSTTGGKIEGSYTFLPKGNNHGAFSWSGLLDDTLNDKNAVKIQTRVHGYGYRTYYNKVDADKYWNEVSYDGAMTQTNYARAKICRDRGSFVPDNCSTERRYDR